jgi:3D (Asp-Asp-Asp) domain-containing protein
MLTVLLLSFPLLADDLSLLSEQTLQSQATDFDLPPPPPTSGQPLRLWSTHYVLHEGAEVPPAEGVALVGVGEGAFPAEAPLHLSERDWCFAALEGSARLERLDGSVLTVNYAGVGALVVDCGPPLGNARWRGQGTVRFGLARGTYGDGTGGHVLAPFRTIATDPTVIPTGSVVYVPSARGVGFVFEGESYTHDGYFFAADVGGAIRGEHIDTYTGVSGSPFPHVGDAPSARFDAVVLAEGHVLEAVFRAAHRP